ncbi:MAG: glycosyltransferase [Bacteroidetes bacterium]|nr:glycosyltransferase [Bacteroidota bacterium]
MKLSVIIVNYNVRYFLELCVDSVLKAAQGFDVEVIVVDNHSTDGSLAMLRQRFPQVIRIENQDNAGFSKANNQGVALARGEYILFLNPDTVMPEDFFRKTIACMDASPGVGALGPRLIDGKGRFAPDSKKSFPNLRVALFKSSGINRIFPRSAYFNSYYAVHVGERQTAPVEVLSGCCMLLRRSVIDQLGFAFDEDYFMYCEDVDLSYRVRQAGFQNLYFPEATLVHYKGESTRKATLSYIRIFNQALATFVRKHYSKGQARVFLFMLHAGIGLRALLGVLRSLFRILRMPLFDTLVLLVTLFLMKNFWVGHIRGVPPVPPNFILATFPAYLFLWIASLWLNGAYDQPYRPLRVVRGMVIGSVFILAYYGLLSASLRYSRGLIMLSGVVGTVALLGLHELLYRFGIFRFIRTDDELRKIVLVGDGSAYEEAADLLQKVPAAPELTGRISVADEGDGTHQLGHIQQLEPLLYVAGIGEVIFCAGSLSYGRMLETMQQCGDQYDYKIHLSGSRGFVGSNSSQASGDLYMAGRHYALAHFSQQRNKRVFDIVTSVAILIWSPVLLLVLHEKSGLFANSIAVLFGRKTWIGYELAWANRFGLPRIRASVLPTYNLRADLVPDEQLSLELAMDYARRYTPGVDAGFLWRNLRWLGRSNNAEKMFWGE